MTKLIFMGTPDFSATVLKGLLSDDRYEILAVVTQPDRAVGRKKVIQETPVKQAAKEAGLPIYQPEKLSGSPEMEAIMNLGADGIVTAAFGQFLSSKLLDSMDFAVRFIRGQSHSGADAKTHCPYPQPLSLPDFN